MKNKFLHTLHKEKKLELVEESKHISNSYLEKSNDCLKSAKLLLENSLFENSIAMSYYAMYNILLALLFTVGIKCENHSGSILLLKLIFDEKKLFSVISKAKKERIDKQYYVITETDEITKDIADEMFFNAEDFVLKLKLKISQLNNDDIVEIRKKFQKL